MGIPKIQPFTGFGNNESIYIQGIVTEDKSLEKTSSKNNVFQNILAMLKRFSGDALPGINIKAVCMGETLYQTTDEPGYFEFHFKTANKKKELDGKKWLTAELEVLDKLVENQGEVKAVAKIRIVLDDTKRMIISDIDDTIIISHSTQTLKKLRLMLFLNARTREPFQGVGKFYQALERGEDMSAGYPFFYVSSSEWNLYDLLEDFFDHNNIPRGVFLLRKMQYPIWKFWKSGQGNHQHKYHKIKFLLTLFPKTRCILIGDSGQKDPEIYLKLVKEYPRRIEAVYIRKIRKFTGDSYREVIKDYPEIITEYLELESTYGAFEHAAEKGFIHPSNLEKFQAERTDL